MRIILLTFVCVTALALPAHISSEPPMSLIEDNKNDSEVFNREIMNALKAIDATKNAMKKTILITHADEVENANNEETFSEEIHTFFDEVFDVLRHPQKYVFGHPDDQQDEMKGTVKATENALSHDDINNTTASHNGFVDKTRDELKRDIEVLHEYIFKIRAEFDEWMVSNKHQNFKSMVIGATSAVVVLILYYILCKCCTRRSRLNHLSSFANDHFASKSGDNESLLPTKRNRRFPSNSDEDI